jgi:cytochrome c-type biogenesis protein CcmH/NrfF
MTCLPAIAGLAAPLLLLATATSPTTAADLLASRPLVNERCPVTIEEFATPSHEVRWNDYSVRFCCEKCQGRFERDPASYVANLPQVPPDVVERTILDAHGEPPHARMANSIERWMRPVLLTLAGVILLWLVIRVARRHAGLPPTAAS